MTMSDRKNAGLKWNLALEEAQFRMRTEIESYIIGNLVFLPRSIRIIEYELPRTGRMVLRRDLVDGDGETIKRFERAVTVKLCQS